MQEILITSEKLAEMLQVSQATIYKWAKAGIIPHLKLEKCVRFRPDDIEEFMARRLRKPLCN